MCLTDIGYSYGYLLANEIEESYHTFLGKLIGDKWYDKVGIEWTQWSDEEHSHIIVC